MSQVAAWFTVPAGHKPEEISNSYLFFDSVQITHFQAENRGDGYDLYVTIVEQDTYPIQPNNFASADLRPLATSCERIDTVRVPLSPVPSTDKPLNSVKANRGYKDSVFTNYFSDPARFIDVYNAIKGTSFTLATPIEDVTLSDVFFKNRKNDLAFKVDNRYVILMEHQSTINDNMPLRMLLYAGRLYESIVNQDNIYKTRRIPLPTPEFLVLYNGAKPMADNTVLRLSDAFIDPPGDFSLELSVQVININYGHNQNIMQKSTALSDYSFLMDKIHAYTNRGVPLQDAIKQAIYDCVSQNIMKQYLQMNGSEVLNMLFGEFDPELEKKVIREEAYEEGRESLLKELIANKLAKGLSFKQVADVLEVDVNTIQRLMKQLP